MRGSAISRTAIVAGQVQVTSAGPRVGSLVNLTPAGTHSVKRRSTGDPHGRSPALYVAVSRRATPARALTRGSTATHARWRRSGAFIATARPYVTFWLPAAFASKRSRRPAATTLTSRRFARRSTTRRRFTTRRSNASAARRTRGRGRPVARTITVRLTAAQAAAASNACDLIRNQVDDKREAACYQRASDAISRSITGSAPPCGIRLSMGEAYGIIRCGLKSGHAGHHRPARARRERGGG